MQACRKLTNHRLGIEATQPLRFGVIGRVGGLSDLWMRATSDVGQRWLGRFAINVKTVLLPVRCPTLFKSVGLLGCRDAESSERQDHGTNTNVGLGAFANTSTSRAFEGGRTDVPLGSNSLKRCIEVISQLN